MKFLKTAVSGGAVFFLLINAELTYSSCAKVYEKLKSAGRLGKDIIKSGGLRILFSPESQIAGPTGRQIWGGLFTEVAGSKSFKESLSNAIHGDFDGYFSQAPVRLLSKTFSGKKYEFTPSNFIANRTRRAPRGNPETHSGMGAPGYRLSGFASGVGAAVANTYIYGVPILAGASYAAYLAIVKPAQAKLPQELEKNRKSIEDYIFYNHDALEILEAIRVREKLTDPALSHAEVDRRLRSKIRLDDLMAAFGRQRSQKAALALLQRYSELGPPGFEEVFDQINQAEVGNPLYPVIEPLKRKLVEMGENISDTNKQKIVSLFQNRLSRSISSFLAGVAIEEKWSLGQDVDTLQFPVNTSKNPQIQQIKESPQAQMDSVFVAKFWPLNEIRNLATGAHDSVLGRKISRDFNDAAVANFYLQKFLAASWDLEFQRIQEGFSFEEFDDRFNAYFEEVLKNEILVRYADPK